eukprot:TRINITY_DN30203_c0_g3_i1.p2 TRINITY_DN30203_c0_g3~~TRINITY_DN30203_c0_g3_i1.p2  ORF type:complete len:180 (-),score=36.79 TRINITY_DN30203_c0_g3_i1:400-939(-)
MSVQTEGGYNREQNVDQQPYSNGGFISSAPPVKQFKEKLFVCKRKRDDEQTESQIEPDIKKFKNQQNQFNAPLKQIKVLVEGLEFNKQQIINQNSTIDQIFQDSTVPGNQSGAIILYKAPEEILKKSILKWKGSENDKIESLKNYNQNCSNGFQNGRQNYVENYEFEVEQKEEDQMDVD